MLTRGGICIPPTVTYLPYRVSGSTLTAVGRFQLLARWPGTHFRILSGIQRAAQTVLGVYLKRTCSRVTSASSAFGVLNDFVLYKSAHSLTRRGVGWSWSASDWWALQSGTCTRYLNSALQMTDDISDMHFKHYSHLLTCRWLTLKIEMIKSFAA